MHDDHVNAVACTVHPDPHDVQHDFHAHALSTNGIGDRIDASEHEHDNMCQHDFTTNVPWSVSIDDENSAEVCEAFCGIDISDSIEVDSDTVTMRFGVIAGFKPQWGSEVCAKKQQLWRRLVGSDKPVYPDAFNDIPDDAVQVVYMTTGFDCIDYSPRGSNPSGPLRPGV